MHRRIRKSTAMVNLRPKCTDCKHLAVVKTLNHPEGAISCKFALFPCEACKRIEDIDRNSYLKR